MAFKASMERRWLAIALERRYVVVAGQKPESGLGNANADSVKTGVLTCQGVDETVRVVRQVAIETQPWRFSVDLPRACLTFLVAGVSYFLYVTSVFPSYICSEKLIGCIHPQHVSGYDDERRLFSVRAGWRISGRTGCGPIHCALERALERDNKYYRD